MATVISIQSIKSLDQIFEHVDRGKNVLVKKGRTIYQIQKRPNSTKTLNDKIHAYIRGYQRIPESAKDRPALTQLAVSVLKREDW